jgi:hypothetical protein
VHDLQRLVRCFTSVLLLLLLLVLVALLLLLLLLVFLPPFQGSARVASYRTRHIATHSNVIYF